MPDREKVIKGLECCTKKVCIYIDTEKECPYCELCGEYEDAFEDCTTALAKDTIALLKAQEPRVMTDTELEEIRKAPLVLKPNVDAAPVVRCRDCKYYAINRLTKAYEPDKRYKPSVCIIGEFARPRKPDWFCADGERRDENATD